MPPHLSSTRKCLSPRHCSLRRMWKQRRQRRLAGRSWHRVVPCARWWRTTNLPHHVSPSPSLKPTSVLKPLFPFSFPLPPSFSSFLIWSSWPVAASAPFGVRPLFYWRLSVSATCAIFVAAGEESREACGCALLVWYAFKLMRWNHASLWC